MHASNCTQPQKTTKQPGNIVFRWEASLLKKSTKTTPPSIRVLIFTRSYLIMHDFASANADLEVANATQFWVGASNLKCNVGWENGGEIEFNELWAPDSRYYGVAIDKMSLGGLWHTVPVGHQLPFVCTFQGKPKDGKRIGETETERGLAAAPPLHAMRAPAKKRPGKEPKPEGLWDKPPNYH